MESKYCLIYDRQLISGNSVDEHHFIPKSRAESQEIKF